MDYIDAFGKFENLSEETYSSSYSYNSLPANDETKTNEITTIVRGNLLRRKNKGLIVILSTVMSVALFVVFFIGKSRTTTSSLIIDETIVSRGVKEGASEKAFLQFYGDVDIDGKIISYPWTNYMLSWQRTAYHFQPEKNWMNGPLFYKGWYHLFYQYNPYGAIWGNIVWGHAVSRDLIHWLYLPEAMVPDHWYDINGVWTGSATLLPDGSIVMIYTGSTNESVQVQNVAFPANLSDPLLIKWIKYSGNPILYPPPGIGLKDFRDPTTSWYTPENKWRITVGSKLGTTGTSLVYETIDFLNYTLLDKVLHEVPGTGMWECVDFYPVSMTGDNGLDTSANGPGVKHVLKASLDDIKKDYYALGSYDVVSDVWTPDDPELDVGIGLRYDYGKFYASKTFYDQNKKRRILWGWIGETDSEHADIEKGWASVQAIPRTVLFDGRTTTNLIQWPVEEVESLRLNSSEFNNINIQTGSVVPLDVGTATQLDITVEFEINEKSLDGMMEEADVGYNCTTSGGAAGRGRLGPFGLLVLADKTQSEQTAVYFYVAQGIDGDFKTFFCTDESGSSEANDVGKQVYGSIVPVLDGDKLSMRILVDHSIVESFAQGGRTCITARVYPTKAIYAATRLFLFNNATKENIKATSIKIWQMDYAFIRPY
ncbi:hypothetical protein MKW98_016882 [Papaver atlanticum]|uniref:Beta-fructofuranosidase n=1 Tax=Papaver atlanticum TaxID=357466 RepID=A0AAD4XYW7_9MAGN|nr:hypothetical protein MKW98_016882 [Papaver atlanticum]